jgi:hypothetical protein
LVVGAVTAVGCTTTDHFEKVDIAIENNPPIAATAGGSAIVLTEGIGIALAVTPYARGRADSSLAVQVDAASANVSIVQGAGGVNELFITGLAPGSGTITLGVPPSATDDAGNGVVGTVAVHVVVMPQM